jgi:hypothetical protein
MAKLTLEEIAALANPFFSPAAEAPIKSLF